LEQGDFIVSDDLIVAFEQGAISNQDFHHADHVHIAYLYLSQFPTLEAVRRFSEGLRNFAARSGKAERYHETITWAFMFLIRERMARACRQNGDSLSWEEFAAENADLLNWKDSILSRYYTKEMLASDLARSTFVLPDRIQEQ
jgi:hypothetical protein